MEATPNRTKTGGDLSAGNVPPVGASGLQEISRNDGPNYVRDQWGQFAPGTAGRQYGCKNWAQRHLEEAWEAPLPEVVAAGGAPIIQAYRVMLYRASLGDNTAQLEVLRLQRVRLRKPRAAKRYKPGKQQLRNLADVLLR